MGIFDYFQTPDAKRAEEVRKGAVVPDRTERKKCWDSRDAFYVCLDKNDVINSLEGEGKLIADKHCSKELSKFEEDCAAAWVTYFKRSRVAEYKKKKTLEKLQHEGANKMSVEGPGDFPGSTKR